MPCGWLLRVACEPVRAGEDGDKGKREEMNNPYQSQPQKARDGTQTNSPQDLFHFYFPAVTRYIKAYLNKLQQTTLDARW
tara:strand:+ start:159 stop:398 length:240 start_codon:yes stop_codon:yes gene_type:complete